MLKSVGFPSSRTGDQTIVDGNLVIATAGKGIDFSATASGTGTPTSELFDKKNERAHELRMLEAEMEFAKIKGEIAMRQADVQLQTADYTRRINTLVSGVSASGFTVEFQRDDGATWTNGQTQAFYWIAIGTN